MIVILLIIFYIQRMLLYCVYNNYNTIHRGSGQMSMLMILDLNKFEFKTQILCSANIVFVKINGMYNKWAVDGCVVVANCQVSRLLLKLKIFSLMGLGRGVKLSFNFFEYKRIIATICF